MADLPEKAFDRRQLNTLEQNVKSIVESNYNMCIYQCNEKGFANGMSGCKQTCYRTNIVPYKMVSHQSASSEDSLFKKCLADKFPNVTPADYTSCTKNVASQRAELMMKHFADSAESLLNKMH